MDHLEDHTVLVSYDVAQPNLMSFNPLAHSTYCGVPNGAVNLNSTGPSIDFYCTENVPTQNCQPRKISRAQWEQVKEVIQTQYVVKNCTLNELIPRMEAKHSFVASKQQYVRKLKEWKFEKNQQNQDWCGIAYALKRRRLEVDNADIYLNGCLVPLKKLKKEISRYDRPTLQTKYANHPTLQVGASPRTPTGFIIERHNPSPIHVSPPFSLPWFDFIDVLTTPASILSSDIFGPTQQDSLVPHASLQERHDLLMSLSRSERTVSNVIRHGEVQQLAARLARQLSPIMVKCTTGDLEEALTEIATTRNPLRLYSLVAAYVVYLCTNNLADNATLSTFAAMLKNHEFGKVFLEQLLDANDITSQIFTKDLFFHSVDKKDVWLLQQIAPRIRDIDMKRNTGRFPHSPNALGIAIRNRDLNIAKLLLSFGSNPNQCLCKTDANCSQGDSCLRSIDLAVRDRSSIELIHDLLDRDAKFGRRRILPLAIRHGADNNLIERLIQAGASIGPSAELKSDFNGSRRVVYDTPLTAAISSGRVDIVEQLIYDKDYPLNLRKALIRKAKAPEMPPRTCDGALCYISPLICGILAEDQEMEIVEMLIAAGADANECICQFMEDGASLNLELPKFLGQWVQCEKSRLRGEDIFSPLQAAVYVENERLVQKLIDSRASLEPCHGPSALLFSVKVGNLSITKFLLQSGAAPGRPGKRGSSITPLMVAIANDRPDIIELLLQYGASIDVDLRTMLPNGEDALVSLYIAQREERIRTQQCPAAQNQMFHGMSNSGTLNLAASSIVTADLSTNCWITPPDVFDLVLRDPHGANLLRICLEGGSDPSRSINDTCWSPLSLTLQHDCGCGTGQNQVVERINLLFHYGGRIGLAELLLMLEQDHRWEIMKQVLVLADFFEESLRGYFAEIIEAIGQEDDDMLLDIVLGVLQAMKWQSPAFKVSQSLCHILFASSLSTEFPTEEIARALFKDGLHINSRIDSATIRPWRWHDPFRSSKRGFMTPLTLLLRWGPYHGIYADDDSMRLPLLKFLIGVGADVNMNDAGSRGKEGWSPLQLACASGGCVDEIRCLVEAGANVNTPAPSVEGGCTALQAATEGGNIEVIKYLVSEGADVNSPAPSVQWGRTALQAAAREGNLEAVEYFLANDADVNAPAGDESGATALQYAAGEGNLRIMQILVEGGANIDAVGAEIEGRTAIEMAAEHGRVDCLYYLLDRYKGQTSISEICVGAAWYARKEGHDVIADFLIKRSQGETTT